MVDVDERVHLVRMHLTTSLHYDIDLWIYTAVYSFSILIQSQHSHSNSIIFLHSCVSLQAEQSSGEYHSLVTSTTDERRETTVLAFDETGIVDARRKRSRSDVSESEIETSEKRTTRSATKCLRFDP